MVKYWTEFVTRLWPVHLYLFWRFDILYYIIILYPKMPQFWWTDELCSYSETWLNALSPADATSIQFYILKAIVRLDLLRKVDENRLQPFGDCFFFFVDNLWAVFIELLLIIRVDSWYFYGMIFSYLLHLISMPKYSWIVVFFFITLLLNSVGCYKNIQIYK